MIDYNESLKILKANLPVYERVENVCINDASGRILAIDLKAKNDFPRFKTASMDGYAVSFDDLKNGILKFKILGKTPAGKFPDFKIKSAECVKTFTGAILCENADTIVPIENVEISGDDEILIKESVSENFAVRKIGESYKKNEILLKKGTRLDFASLGLLAELGFSKINVFSRPKIAILVTGSELLEIGQKAQNDSQIYSSNHIILNALIHSWGGDSEVLPIIKDDKNALKNAVKKALENCDFLITTGGVSVGDYDFMRDIMHSSDFEILIDKVAVKPGRHIKIAKFGEKLIFALPGFSVSAAVMSFLFVRETLNEILNIHENFKISAVLAENYMKKSKFLEFVPCSLKIENTKIFASIYGKKSGSSAIISNLINSDLFLAPLEKTELKKGEIVEVLLLKSKF